MVEERELPLVVRVVAGVVSVAAFVAGQVVAFGGVWAAWTGNDFWFWQYADSGPDRAAALLIVFVGEPLVMGAAWLVVVAVTAVLTLVAAPFTAAGRRPARRSVSGTRRWTLSSAGRPVAVFTVAADGAISWEYLTIDPANASARLLVDPIVWRGHAELETHLGRVPSIPADMYENAMAHTKLPLSWDPPLDAAKRR